MKYELTDETIKFFGHTLRRIRYLDTGELGGFIEYKKNLSQRGNARVLDNAAVFENAKVYGDAIVSGNAEVCGNAEIWGDALIQDNANVHGNSKVYGKAVVGDNAIVFDDATINHDANVSERAVIANNAFVTEYAEISGHAIIYGNAQVSGNTKVSGNSKIHGCTILLSGTWATSPLQIQGTRYHFHVSGERTVTVGCITKTVEDWRIFYEKLFIEYNFTEKEKIEYISYFNLASKLYGYGFTLPLPGEK